LGRRDGLRRVKKRFDLIRILEILDILFFNLLLNLRVI
jgi:hypothetical protein